MAEGRLASLEQRVAELTSAEAGARQTATQLQQELAAARASGGAATSKQQAEDAVYQSGIAGVQAAQQTLAMALEALQRGRGGRPP